MATVAETQANLGADAMSPRIIKSEDAATLRQNYVLGGAAFPGRARWITTTIADTAVAQGNAIRAALV